MEGCTRGSVGAAELLEDVLVLAYVNPESTPSNRTRQPRCRGARISALPLKRPGADQAKTCSRISAFRSQSPLSIREAFLCRVCQPACATYTRMFHSSTCGHLAGSRHSFGFRTWSFSRQSVWQLLVSPQWAPRHARMEIAGQALREPLPAPKLQSKLLMIVTELRSDIMLCQHQDDLSIVCMLSSHDSWAPHGHGIPFLPSMVKTRLPFINPDIMSA